MNIVFVLIATLVFTTMMMLLCIREVIILHRLLRSEDQTDHAKCMALITAFVGDRFAAQVLRAAARDWDSVEAQPDIRRIANEKYRVGGPSMPYLWMIDRAEKLEAEEPDTASVTDYEEVRDSLRRGEQIA